MKFITELDEIGVRIRRWKTMSSPVTGDKWIRMNLIGFHDFVSVEQEFDAACDDLYKSVWVAACDSNQMFSHD